MDTNHFRCFDCYKDYSLEEPRWRCDCGGLLDIEHQPTFDLKRIRSSDLNMWRYRGAIPLPAQAAIVSFQEGYTPLLPLSIGGREVLVKQEQLFQTGSFKDRGASVLLSAAKSIGVRSLIEDSSGNAGCAVAAYAARAGIKSRILTPAETSPEKLSQIESYGAELELVAGDREATSKAALVAAESQYYASHSWNPYFIHGTKTFAFELVEQLGWTTPDVVVLPVGNGTLLLGTVIGFQELVNAGVVASMPRVVGVQASSCDPLTKAFQKGRKSLGDEDRIASGSTIAEGIAVVAPVRSPQILAAVRATQGELISVSEDEIAISLKEICGKGFFVEPTSAVAIAGLKRYLDTQERADERVVSVFTGHGLKSAMKVRGLLG
jgi:threonine synthase